MKISVIVPTKNRADFLKKTLTSVANQTTQPDEVLILDDCSTDNTKEVVESFGSRFRHIVQPFENQTKARNYGIKVAEGDLIAFLDSDDFWLEKKLEDQLSFINVHEGFSFCYTDSVVVDLDQNETPHSYIYKYRKYNDYQGKIAKKLLFEYNVIPTSSVMVSKQLLNEVGCFDEKLQYHEDRDLWIRLSTIGDVIFLDKALSIYTVHSGQFTYKNDDLRNAQWQMLKAKYKGWRGDTSLY